MSTLDSNPANPATVSLRPVALRWGLILAGISALLTLIGFLTDTDPSMPDTGTAVKLLYGLLGFGIMIACIVAAIRQHRDKDLGGYITLGRALMVGLVTGLVAGVLGAVFFMLYATIINPDFTENMKDGMVAQWQAQGMSEEAIDQASKIGFMFVNPYLLAVFNLIGGFFYGILIGLVAGAIMKKEPPQQTI